MRRPLLYALGGVVLLLFLVPTTGAMKLVIFLLLAQRSISRLATM